MTVAAQRYRKTSFCPTCTGLQWVKRRPGKHHHRIPHAYELSTKYEAIIIPDDTVTDKNLVRMTMALAIETTLPGKPLHPPRLGPVADLESHLLTQATLAVVDSLEHIDTPFF